MDVLLRFLNRPVHLRPAGPRARSVLWLLLAGWVVLHAGSFNDGSENEAAAREN